MRRRPQLLLLPLIALVAACSNAGAAPSPSVVPSEAPASTVPSPSSAPASPAADTYWLRLTTWQAIPPLNLFPQLDTAVITGDGILVTPGAIPMIYPGPLVPPLFGQQVSDAGRAQIMAWAKELGLTSGKTDFQGSSIPGGITGHVELTVDGKLVELVGNVDTSGMTPTASPQPGSPEAFTEFWRRVTNLQAEIPNDLGPSAPYTPPAYSLLVGAPPVPEQGMTAQIMDWPLDTPLATFGTSVANGTARCGNVSGADADTLRPALEQANQLTQWVQDPNTSATYGLTVRPLVPGEDQCKAVFGVE